MPASVSTWTLSPGCNRRRKPSRFSFRSIRSYRHNRQLNLNSQSDHRGSPTSRIRSSDWQVLEEKVGANYKNRYVWSPSYIDALVTRDRDTDANGTLYERLYPQHDANFNVTAITNTSGTVQERYTPDPFGVVTFRDASGNTISASAKDWVFLHQGGQADNLGHYDYRNRILSPTLGRWLTNDPLGFRAGDTNFYRYIGNPPGSNTDPFGLAPTSIHVRVGMLLLKGEYVDAKNYVQLMIDTAQIAPHVGRQLLAQIAAAEATGLAGTTAQGFIVGTLTGAVRFGKNFLEKARKHIDQVRNRGPIKDNIPKIDKGGAERIQQIIRDRVSKGGGEATTNAGEPAVKFVDGKVSYIFRPNGEFWTILGN